MDLSFPYTHNNHFRFGYYLDGNQVWYCSPEDTQDMQWVVEFGTCETTHDTGLAFETSRVAKLIADSSDETPNIMFSGGNESEIVVRAFQRMGIPFRVSILKFKKNLNIHDIAFAVVFCEQQGIPYDIVELDILHFMEQGVYDYCNWTNCPSPQLAPTMWLADQIDGLPILGSGEPYVMKRVPDDYVPGMSMYEPSEWYFQEKERIQAWYRHFIQQGRPAVPGFFQYTPELMYMFLTNPVVKDLVADRRIGKLSTVSTKNEFYWSELPDMIRRPKFHGFEKIMEWDEVAREVLVADHGYADRVAEWEYHDFVRRLAREH